MGKTHYKWSFSIVMLNYQRVQPPTHSSEYSINDLFTTSASLAPSSKKKTTFRNDHGPRSHTNSRAFHQPSRDPLSKSAFLRKTGEKQIGKNSLALVRFTGIFGNDPTKSRVSCHHPSNPQQAIHSLRKTQQ